MNLGYIFSNLSLTDMRGLLLDIKLEGASPQQNDEGSGSVSTTEYTPPNGENLKCAYYTPLIICHHKGLVQARASFMPERTSRPLVSMWT